MHEPDTDQSSFDEDDDGFRSSVFPVKTWILRPIQKYLLHINVGKKVNESIN